MFFSKVAAATLAIALTATAACAETALVPAAKMFPFLDAYYGLPVNQRDQFKMVYFFYMKDMSREKVSLVLKSTRGDVPMTIAADYRVTPLPSAADLKAKRDIAMTAPKGGKIGLDIKLTPTLAPGAVMNAAPLAQAVKQAHDGAKKAAGLFSLAVPDYKAVCFDGARSGNVALKSGRSVALKIQGGRPCFVPSETPDAIRVTLDRSPSAMYIEPKAK